MIPNPLKSPAPIQLIQWVADPVGYMERAAERYGNIFTAKIGLNVGDLVFVNHPEGIQQLLTQDRQEFAAPGSVNRLLLPLVGDYSVIMLDGNRHRRERQLLMPPFHGDRMRAYGDLIGNLSQKAFAQIPVGEPFTARTVMQEISLQVILEAVFGLHEGERSEQLKSLMAQMMDVFHSPLTSSFLFFHWLQRDLGSWSPWVRFNQQQQQIDELLYAEIAERRDCSDSTKTDILSLLMSARDEAGNPLSDRELRDELMTLLFAGHETTATAMAWALYWVHYHPAVKDKLLQELATLEERDPVNIARLPYLTAVCQEALRIYPVAMLTFPRVVQEPVELMGYHLEPGAVVMGCIYLVHHQEDLYPNPKQFQPERFLERKFTGYEFLPFGGGARRCIGEALAQYEMKLVLATVLTQYELTLADTETPQRRGVTLAPAKGVRMVMQGRRSPHDLSTQSISPSTANL